MLLSYNEQILKSTHFIVAFFWPWSSKGVAYANFISDLLSVVFPEYTELIRLLEMECLI